MQVDGLETDWPNCRVLIADRDPAARTLLVAMLRDFGVLPDNIEQAARVHEAQQWLETQHFDIVLCDYHFGPDEMSGQDLLDELRRTHALPLTTVFVMVTAEASYAKVAEAAESALDSYLLKPHNAQSLGERLALARHRKLTLSEIYAAIDAGEFDQAIHLCLERYHAGERYGLYAARVAAELMLRRQRLDEAHELFLALDEARGLPWARLGMARAHLEAGRIEPASQTLHELIEQQPTYADAYDLMGRAHLEQGEFSAAMQTYARAAELTPGSISRQQKLGMMAYYLGDQTLASHALQAACELSVQSKTFDHQSLVLMAFMQFEQGDEPALARSAQWLAAARQRRHGDPRLGRMLQVVDVLRAMLARQLSAVIQELQRLAQDYTRADFDMEAACNALTLLAHLRRADLDLPQAPEWIDLLAKRFCTSKAASALLARACACHEPFATRVKEAHVEIGGWAERALQHAVQQAPDKAVQTLLAQGRQTMNVKLLELAGMVLQRHRDDIADPAPLAQALNELRERMSPAPLPLARAPSGMREPGGLALRAPR